MHAHLNTLLARLLINAAIPFVLFVAVALVATVAIRNLLDALRQERHTHEVIGRALYLQQKLDQMRLEIHRVPLLGAEGLSADYQAQRREFQATSRLLYEMVQDNSRQQEQLLRINQVEAEWHRLVEERLQDLKPRPDLSRSDFQRRCRDFFEPLLDVSKGLEKEIEDFTTAEEGLLEERRTRVSQQTRETIVAIAGTVGVALVLTVLSALYSARGVTRPVNRLREAAGQLITGRYQTVPADGPTEIAELIRHFNHMALALSERTSALQEQEQRYRTYLGAVSHILWITNAVGEVIRDLPTWRAFTGQSEEAIRGLGWLDAVHPQDRAATEQTWRQAVRDRSPYEVEYRLRGHDGTYRYFSCRGVPVLAGDGAVQEWIGTCTDITERKNEAALVQAKEAAEAKSRTKSEFLAKISHELRTPLNAVIGMSKMLSTQRFGPLNAKQADYLQDITQAGEHLLALINDILDLAKVEAGRMDV
jgi:PAS domain S-box-containing protein